MGAETIDLDAVAQRAVASAREIILQETEDDNGLSNQDKWNFCQDQLEELRVQGFFAPVDFDHAYEWELGNRLLAYCFIANLRCEVFIKLLRESKEFEERNRFDLSYHTHRNYYLRIKDKYESVSGGKHDWKHIWLN